MRQLYLAVKEFIFQQGKDKTFWVAYSGGLDSHVLLSLCHELTQEYPINFHVIYVNHHLHPDSLMWSKHCEKVCASYGMNFLSREIQLNLKNGDSLEELAREQRYAVFLEFIKNNDVLLTAHHQDDQAETLILQLLRGAGPKGLAAMPFQKSFGKGVHGRPLLNFSRKDLYQYAQSKGLIWINDTSNNDLKYTRNFIRQDILPRLAARWPTVTNMIARSALHCAESQELLEEFSSNVLSNIKNSNKNTLSVSKLLLLNDAQQRLVLRSWIKLNGFSLPNAKKIETIRKEVLMAGIDRMPCVSWGNVEIRRYRDELYLLNKLDKYETHLEVSWNFSQALYLTGVGTLSMQPVLGAGFKADWQQAIVRFRQGGEVVTLPGRGRHTLKNLFQEWGVPTWERNKIPLLFIENKCVGAVGYFIDDDYTAKKNEEGLMPVLERIK